MKIIFKTIVIILISMLLLGCEGNNTDSPNTNVVEYIKTSEVKALIDNKDESYVIIDVREESEYNEGHLIGAVNIPLGNIESIDYDKEKTLIVYCRSGSRSHTAATKLNNMGYKVKDMGGIINWTYEIE